MKKPKRECFKYEREICNTYPESYLHNVTWENEKLDEVDKEEVQDCKKMDACEMVPEVKEEERVIQKQVCNKTRTEQKEQCSIEYQQGAEQVKKDKETVDFQKNFIRLCSVHSLRLTTDSCVRMFQDKSARATLALHKDV